MRLNFLSSYRALTRKHHPDRNPDNADAERVMSVVNVAYGVLSGPVKRSEHDRWIARAEGVRVEPATPRAVRGRPIVHMPTARYQTTPGEAERMAGRHARQVRLERRVRRTVTHLLRHRVSYGVAGIVGLCLVAAGISAISDPGLVSPMGSAALQNAQAAPLVAGYVRAEAAPNGQPWPARSAYVDGYAQMNKGGLSEVMVDNLHNDNDVFAKLFSLDGPSALPVRTFFVAARSRFALTGLAIGTYDLRYRNLASGGLMRSPAFILEEVATARGTEHSMPVMKLYQGGESGMQTYALGDAEF